jgi:acetyltransferase-like isoleucine patch superfamily enzyme
MPLTGSRGKRRRLGRAVTRFLLQGRAAPLVRRAISAISLNTYRIYGDPTRLRIADGVVPMNTLFNTVSGTIEIGPEVIFGHNVSLLTGSHDHRLLGAERASGVPSSGRDIVIERGVWIASSATVIGPCRVGAHAVLAAGALARDDVPAYAIVAGVPASVVGYVTEDRPA